MIKAVLDDYRTTGSARLLLIVLADMAGDEGKCWPSIALLRKRMNIGSDRAVQSLLKSLEEGGLIAREMRVGHSTMYRVLLQGGEAQFTTEQPFGGEAQFTRGVKPSSPGGCTTVHQGGEAQFTQNRNRTTIEPSRNQVSAHVASGTDIDTAPADAKDPFSPSKQDQLITERLKLNPEWEPIARAKSEGKQNPEAYFNTLIAKWDSGEWNAPSPKKEPAPPVPPRPPLPEVFQGCLGEGIGENTVRLYLGQAMARLSQEGIWDKAESPKNAEHCRMAIDLAQRDFRFSDPRAKQQAITHPATGAQLPQ